MTTPTRQPRNDGPLEDAEQRAQAAARCQPCPVITACALAAESTRERWGVWAGRDLSPSKRKARP